MDYTSNYQFRQILYNQNMPWLFIYNGAGIEYFNLGIKYFLSFDPVKGYIGSWILGAQANKSVNIILRSEICWNW